MLVSQAGKLNDKQLHKINLFLDSNLKMLYEQESNFAVSLNENVRKQIIDDLNEKDGSLYIHIDSQFDHAYGK
jgi:hypothetical protein